MLPERRETTSEERVVMANTASDEDIKTIDII